MVSAAATKKIIQRKCKIHGFTLSTDAIEEVLSFLAGFPDAEDEALELLIDQIDRESLKSAILDKATIDKVFSLLLETNEAVDPCVPTSSDRAALKVIDAFVVHRLKYYPIKRVFYEHTGRLPIHGEASDKASLYRERYHLLHQRLSRDKYFSRPVFDTDIGESGSCEITSIQSLIDCTERRWLMGVISQLEEGSFYLEDLTAAAPIDLSNAKITSGFFVENTIIVAEGELLSNGTFQVNTCGFPPLEDRDESLSVLMGLDFFGGGILSAEEMLRLSALEKKAVNDIFVILSDVWVDDEETMKKLSVVFDGYESVEVVPSLFVLMGNFCSHPCNLAFHSFATLREQFGKLGEMIKSHSRIKDHSRFLFIPGPDDIGPSKALPRCVLPKYLIEALQENVPSRMLYSMAIPAGG